jgi:tetratricopeptide (TPR) repeat protein
MKIIDGNNIIGPPSLKGVRKLIHMGNLTSFFEASPLPVDPIDFEETTGVPSTIELDNAPLRSSLLWQIQSHYYSSCGQSAWADGTIPQFITSNSFIAFQYAKVILAKLHDEFDQKNLSGSKADEPMIILELGSGSGKLCFLILLFLMKMEPLYPKTNMKYPFLYVASDAFLPILTNMQEMDVLRPFIEKNILDFALLDASASTKLETINLLHQKRTISSTSRSSIVLSNYTFNSLRMDSFRISDNTLYQSKLKVSMQSSLFMNSTLTASTSKASVIESSPTSVATVDVVASSEETASSSTAKMLAFLDSLKKDPRGILEKIEYRDILQHLQLSWEFEALGPVSSPETFSKVYPASPVLASLLKRSCEILSLPSGTSTATFLLPIGAVECVLGLAAFFGNRWSLLVGDKGIGRWEEAIDSGDPALAVHGSFSMGVNFPILSVLASALDGRVLRSERCEGFKVAGVFFEPADSQGRPWDLDAWVLSRLEDSTLSENSHADKRDDAENLFASSQPAYLAVSALAKPTQPLNSSRSLAETVFDSSFGGRCALSPEDFSTLQRSLKEEAVAPSLKLVTSLLRLAKHETDVFIKFKAVMIEKSSFPQLSEPGTRDLLVDIDDVLSCYYPLQPEKDVCFEVGRILMGLQRYREAIAKFDFSNQHIGTHHITYHNIGICYYYLGEFKESFEAFQRCLELNANYAEAKLWIDRAYARIVSSESAAPPNALPQIESQ